MVNDSNIKGDDFENALLGKKLPILPLDNKWYRLMSAFEMTDEMRSNEEGIKDLLKRQGKLNNEIKNLKKLKQKLMDEIVGSMDDADALKKQNELKARIEECNNKIDEFQDEVLDLPKEINKLNYSLMLATMSQCYESIKDNNNSIQEISDWIDEVRVKLKTNLIKKQDKELKNQEIYNYMHDIFGADVIDIFDMKFNPADKQLKKNGDK